MDDNKKSTTIWLRPSMISRMDGWLEADNCQSRSEFVDKALHFYEAVKWAQKKGITGGTGSGLFGPNNDCTRTQIGTLIFHTPRRGRVPIRYAPFPGGKMSVTICVRVQSSLGSNKPLLMPPVMPFFSAHFTTS